MWLSGTCGISVTVTVPGCCHPKATLDGDSDGDGRTHNGSTERVEGIGATGVEVRGVQPLQKPHVVEALGLWWTGCTLVPGDTTGPSLPGDGRTLLFLPFCRQSSCFSGDASQWICTGRSTITA